jgi:uncharacterized protein (TIGR02001 family)
MKRVNLFKTAFLAVTICMGTSALAADPETDAVSADEGDVSFSYGVALTSNYISRGTTQSDDHAAVQGYVEASIGILYGGVWASSVDFNTPDKAELDFYAGIRPEIGDLSLDLGYVRYYYDDSGDCCGEWYAKGAYAFSETVSAGGEYYYDNENDTHWAVATTEVSGLPMELTFSGQVGSDFGSLKLGSADKVAWNAGLSHALGDNGTIDLRVHDSNYDPMRFVATVSFDF